MRVTKPVVATLATMVVLGGLGSIVPPLSARQRAEVSGMGTASRLIGALDGCIQERFKDVNDCFGIARLVKIDERAHRFGARERRGNELGPGIGAGAPAGCSRRSPGTRVMRPTPRLPLVGDAARTGDHQGTCACRPPAPAQSDGPGPPSPSALWEDGRRAMSAFATSVSSPSSRSQAGASPHVPSARRTERACSVTSMTFRGAGTVPNEPVRSVTRSASQFTDIARRDSDSCERRRREAFNAPRNRPIRVSRRLRA